jgi:hypothetical protein
MAAHEGVAALGVIRDKVPTENTATNFGIALIAAVSPDTLAHLRSSIV